MLAMLVKENQTDWDLNMPKVFFAYKTTLHESTGCSSYQVNFGWSPNLPVDAMLDRISLPGEREVKETPEFVRGVNGWLKWVYDNVKWNLNKAHQRKKSKYDEKFAGENLTVINRVLILYLCCEARKNKETVFIVAWPLHNKRQGWSTEYNWLDSKDIASALEQTKALLQKATGQSEQETTYTWLVREGKWNRLL